MKITILYEQKKFTCEMKQIVTTEDIISNMRKLLGHKENQNYIICDIHGINIKPNKLFNPEDKDITLILMTIPIFNPEEPLYNDDIKKDISEVSDNPSSVLSLLNNLPVNHGNPNKNREASQELIGNIYGSFNDLPDLLKETTKKK